MKKFTLLAALILIGITACQKEEIKPSNPNLKNKIRACRTCEGHWDLRDTIPN